MSTRPPGCGEDVAAYALGALGPEETREFERHVRDCELCAADLAALRPAVAALPRSAEPVDPPPDLKKRIMAVVEAEAKERRRAEAPERGRRRISFRLLPAAAAGALAVAVAAIALMSGGGDDTTTIQASVEPPGSDVELRMKDGHGTLVVDGVGPPPAGRVYQVWKKRGSAAPEPTDALFTTTSDGTASVAVPGDLEGVDQVLVSDEPPGGSRAPTTAARIVVDT